MVKAHWEEAMMAVAQELDILAAVFLVLEMVSEARQ